MHLNRDRLNVSLHDIPEIPPATKSIAKSLFMVAAVVLRVLRSNVTATGNAANANKTQGPLMLRGS